MIDIGKKHKGAYCTSMAMPMPKTGPKNEIKLKAPYKDAYLIRISKKKRVVLRCVIAETQPVIGGRWDGMYKVFMKHGKFMPNCHKRHEYVSLSDTSIITTSIDYARYIVKIFREGIPKEIKDVFAVKYNGGNPYIDKITIIKARSPSIYIAKSKSGDIKTVRLDNGKTYITKSYDDAERVKNIYEQYAYNKRTPINSYQNEQLLKVRTTQMENMLKYLALILPINEGENSRLIDLFGVGEYEG